MPAAGDGMHFVAIRIRKSVGNAVQRNHARRMLKGFLQDMWSEKRHIKVKLLLIRKKGLATTEEIKQELKTILEKIDENVSNKVNNVL